MHKERTNKKILLQELSPKGMLVSRYHDRDKHKVILKPEGPLLQTGMVTLGAASFQVSTELKYRNLSSSLYSQNLVQCFASSE